MKKYLFIFLLLTMPAPLGAVVVSVEVNTGRESVNAVGGTLVLPKETVVREIYTGESAVLIWVTNPILDEKTSSISFAGLTPGGFSGKRALFTLDLSSVEGAYFSELLGYRNDGVGAAIPIGYSFSPKNLTDDLEAPEPFEIKISDSPDVFEGRPFLNFSAQDKNTGVDHYEYASVWLFSPSEESWVKADSPLPLKFYESFKKLHIRAYDKAGHHTESSTASNYRYAMMLFGLIIIVCIVGSIKRSLFLRS